MEPKVSPGGAENDREALASKGCPSTVPLKSEEATKRTLFTPAAVLPLAVAPEAEAVRLVPVNEAEKDGFPARLTDSEKVPSPLSTASRGGVGWGFPAESSPHCESLKVRLAMAAYEDSAATGFKRWRHAQHEAYW